MKPKKHGNKWSKRLKELRTKHNLTQKAAAQKIGVSLRTWINWEHRNNVPSGPCLALLEREFSEILEK